SLFSFSILIRHLPTSTLFPYTTLFRSRYILNLPIKQSQILRNQESATARSERKKCSSISGTARKHTKSLFLLMAVPSTRPFSRRSEEHTSELQSQSNLVCRLLLEKKKK